MAVNDWENPSLPHRNRLDPRAYFVSQPDEQQALFNQRGQSTRFQLLNGQWAFSYAERVADAPVDFDAPALDDDGWDEITVPSSWQCQGYDHPHYTNVT